MRRGKVKPFMESSIADSLRNALDEASHNGFQCRTRQIKTTSMMRASASNTQETRLRPQVLLERRPIIRRYARHQHLAYSDGTEFRLRGRDACIRGGGPTNRSSFHIQLDIRRSQQIPFSRIMQNGERR